MVELIATPDPHTLLPPLLACLPTSFASSRPPPSLLSLLSPILRQRLQLITSTASSNTENWLGLLCWDNEKAQRLKDVVENGTYEPHPSSGEIETGEVESLTYKRFDQETLRVQIPLPDWDLTALYLWCVGDEGGNGWKLAELLPYDSDMETDESWSRTIGEANETSKERIFSEAMEEAEAAREPAEGIDDDDDDDDDDYWAQYDKTPARTPGTEKSTMPSGSSGSKAPAGQSDADYYAQYGQVQPAMDGHDPSEEAEDTGDSSLKGNTLESIIGRQSSRQPPTLGGANFQSHSYGENVPTIVEPQPSSPSSNSSDRVSRLEDSAERQTNSEIGIRQHISTSMKSMFRLAKSAGLDRKEFERMVNRELETLSMLEDDN